MEGKKIRWGPDVIDKPLSMHHSFQGLNKIAECYAEGNRRRALHCFKSHFNDLLGKIQNF